MKAHERQYFRAFVNVIQAISSTLDLQEVLDRIVANAVEVLELKAGIISLWNKHENRLEVVSHLNLSQEFLDKGPVYADRSIPRALTTKKPVVIPNIEYDDQLQYPEACKKEGIQALLSIPMIFKDEIIGVLRLYDDKIRQFSEEDVEFVTALAEQGGVAIKNALFMDQLKKDHAQEMDDLAKWFSDMAHSARE
ncbi:MAG: GAF domain-containing protein [Fidelibacterota bacterium]|nr:MAG: GAF domain-containing protein [Candidatus Neomarinimicrobiota bacterium]